MNLIRQIARLLSRTQRYRYFALLLFLLVAGIFQVLGVASIAPFIALVSRPEMIHRNAMMQWAYSMSGVTTDLAFMELFGLSLMLLIVVTNVISALSTWRIAAVAVRVGEEFQQDIYRGFLHRPFETVARTNSSDLISVIKNDANRFVHMVLQPLLTLISQAIVVTFVAVGLFLYDPRVALGAAGIIGGGYFAVFSVLKRYFERHGSVAWRANSRKLHLLADSLGGLKEIKLAGLEAHYEQELYRTSAGGTRSNVLVALLGDLPRFALESLAFCALLGLGIFLLHSFRQPEYIVGVLSLYGMAGYKLLPAAQVIFKSAAHIKSNANVLELIGPAILAGRSVARVADETPPPGDASSECIRFERVSYRYPESPDDVVRDLSFEIVPQALTVIVGASGAGKSTVADLLLGLLPPREGRITMNGVSIHAMGRVWYRRIGYVAQNIFLLDDSIAANIAFGSPPPVDEARMVRVAEQAHVSEFARTKPEGLAARVGERGGLLSGGQRQRVGIARALYKNASLLVMDEATSALDSITEREIIETLLELRRSRTVVMIAHRVSTIQAADHVVLLEKGRLVAAGRYEELLRDIPSFKQLMAAGDQNAALIPSE
jgi:ABC-type multidrug transport system fused ATPase/permease subunit